jgi:NADH:ubiquinone oxidoreductase subunit D
MVVKSLNEYMNDQLSDRVQTLQQALNQAEQIIFTLEIENQRLKDVLISLSSENNGYILDSEAFNEPVCSV